MGSNRFHVHKAGSTIGEAYNKAVSDAAEEYGHQENYSGQINSTYNFTDLTKAYSASGMSESEFIDTWLDDSEKGLCGAICRQKPKGNPNKTKSKVKHNVKPGTKKWVTYYCAYETLYTDTNGTPLGKKKLKADAVKLCREHTEKTKNSSHVVIEKHMEGQSPITAEIDYKPAKHECDGGWVFFGNAPD